jgi:hypothetical protein
MYRRRYGRTYGFEKLSGAAALFFAPVPASKLTGKHPEKERRKGREFFHRTRFRKHLVRIKARDANDRPIFAKFRSVTPQKTVKRLLHRAAIKLERVRISGNPSK